MESEHNNAGKIFPPPAKIMKRNFWGDVILNFYKVYPTALMVGTLVFILCFAMLYVQKASPYNMEKRINKTESTQGENNKLAETNVDSSSDVQVDAAEEEVPKKADKKTASKKTPKKDPEPTPIPDTSSDGEDENVYWDDENCEDAYWDDEEYIIPDSDTRKLTKSDVKNLSDEDLRIARNEIYARRGRRFKDEALQEYFDSMSWYDGYIEPDDFVDSEELSELERRNAKFIQKEEASR